MATGTRGVGCAAGIIWAAIFCLLVFIALPFHPDMGGADDAAFALIMIVSTAWFWGGFFLTHWILHRIAEKKERRENEEHALQRQRDEAERERRDRIARERAKQEGLYREVQDVCVTSLDAFTDIPRSLLSAEELLDVAENDFREEAFSPFWDAIERAVNKLGTADTELQTLEKSARRYAELAGIVDRTPPSFPVDLEAARSLVVANATGKRLKAIVRVAQRNFQFATIYEQRKTNQILVSGFNNLGDAIAGLGDQVSRSLAAVSARIADVTSSVRDMHAGLASSLHESREQQDRIASNLSEQQESIAAKRSQEAADQAESARKQLAMLDNLQRGRSPGLFEDRP